MSVKRTLISALVFIATSALVLLVTRQSAHAQPEKNCIDAIGHRVGFWQITAGMLHLKGWDDTALAEEGRYFDNHKDGPWNTYFPNGNLQSVITWKDGVLHGKTLVYNENNHVIKEVEYENGVPQGLMLTYYPDGTMWAKTTWKKGSIDGPATTYYPNGKVYEEGTWKHKYWTGTYS